MNSNVQKWCGVPQYENLSLKTPDKLFMYVPHNKTTRTKWLKLARRDSKAILPETRLYFCEDHFDVMPEVAEGDPDQFKCLYLLVETAVAVRQREKEQEKGLFSEEFVLGSAMDAQRKVKSPY